MQNSGNFMDKYGAGLLMGSFFALAIILIS